MIKIKEYQREDLKRILLSGFVVLAGLLLLKYFPMSLFGKDILFDASGHLSIAIFILYVLYLGIDHIRTWRLPYIIFSIAVLTIISLQRILTNNHNDFGLLLGLVLGVVAILIAEGKDVIHRFRL